MRNDILILLFVLTFSSCKKFKKQDASTFTTEDVSQDTIYNSIEKNSLRTGKDSLVGTYDFEEFLNTSVDVKNTGGKHTDWMSNHVGFMDRLLGLKRDDIVVKTTSFTFKKECVFYVHSLKHTNDSISIKPFVENVQGKRTEGYTQVRVLIFAMKNEKEVNIIDIPPNYGYSKLRNDLIEKVYSEIDFMVISCDSTEVCRVRDLRD